VPESIACRSFRIEWRGGRMARIGERVLALVVAVVGGREGNGRCEEANLDDSSEAGKH
jgi:hypothetical protein